MPMAEQAASFLGRKLSEIRMVTCHIGNGVSITAIDRGYQWIPVWA